jgi:hypothetical protein
MKPLTRTRLRPIPLHRLIEESTDAPAKDFSQIENIMREEIFHSTLDWQSREQLADAARQAFARLNADREMYDRDHACRIAMFQRLRAEADLREHDTPANHAAVAEADARYQAAKESLFAQLDTTTSD